MRMNKERITEAIDIAISEFGANPFEFFWILTKSENPNLDFEEQNKGWSFVKSEDWHSLNLEKFYLWAISDNGDLLWWDGQETILMNPRDNAYLSEPASPKQFLNLVKLNKVGKIIPDDLA